MDRSSWVRGSRVPAPCDCWYSIEHRCASIDRGYLFKRSTEGWTPIPVPPELQLTHTDGVLDIPPSSRPSTESLKVCLDHINKLQMGRWLDKRVPAHVGDATTLTVQLFIRIDATDRQKAAVVDLFSLNAVSHQLMHEIAFERLLGIFIRNILSVHIKHFSFISDGENRQPENTDLTLFVVTFENVETERKLYESWAARANMARLLHKTLIYFVMHHYRTHDWAYDRRLSDADAAVMMDARLCVYSIFCSRSECTVISHSPRLDKQSDGRYRWRFDMTQWVEHQWVMPLEYRDRIGLLTTMLAMEQHIYELRGLLALDVESHQ
ncbi:hypothetical protein B0H21DRAFT_750399 [Amylocystis lapponica]|nr:hypothetical protein B0H21DRAFT_750399 [Amylocystis lapponica]